MSLLCFIGKNLKKKKENGIIFVAFSDRIFLPLRDAVLHLRACMERAFGIV